MRLRNLTDAIYRALTGGRTPRSEGKTTQEKARALVKAHGSVKAAAKAVGVNVETMRRWASGKQKARNTKRARNADKLAAAERRARMTKAGVARVRNATGRRPGSGEGLRIRATVQVSQDRRQRVIRPGESLPAGALDSVVAAFEEKGAEAAAQELQDLLNFYYFQGARGSIEDIEEIAW